jgi:C4-dicarboxylate transporter, DctM subunit
LFGFLTVVLLLLALLGSPLFAVLAGLGMLCFFFVDFDPLSLQSILIEMNRLATMPVLMALPFFTCLGCLLTASRSPTRIMNFLQSFLGWLPGGLGVAALGACAFFTALTGASGVTIVALGGILYPVLRESGYPEKFSLGLLTTGGSLGLLFPPSLPVILYGVVGRVDIAGIFRAALVPGVLILLVLSIYALVHRRRVHHRELFPSERAVFSWRKVGTTFREGIWEWPMVLIIGIGIYGGFATVVEVSVVVLCYAVVVACFIRKEVDFSGQLPDILVEGMMLAGAIIAILGFAMGFTGFLVDEQIPARILKGLSAFTQNRYLFLALMNLFLLGVGCIMDIFSAIVVVVPILVPVALQYGIDPVHLAVIFLVNLEIGYSTPPVGMNLFIASLKFEKPVTLLYRSSIPYLLLLLGLLLLITYAPFLSGIAS